MFSIFSLLLSFFYLERIIKRYFKTQIWHSNYPYQYVMHIYVIIIILTLFTACI